MNVHFVLFRFRRACLDHFFLFAKSTLIGTLYRFSGRPMKPVTDRPMTAVDLMLAQHLQIAVIVNSLQKLFLANGLRSMNMKGIVSLSGLYLALPNCLENCPNYLSYRRIFARFAENCAMYKLKYLSVEIGYCAEIGFLRAEVEHRFHTTVLYAVLSKSSPLLLNNVHIPPTLTLDGVIGSLESGLTSGHRI